MKIKTFFSIIVPVYNVEKYLVSCIESILQQSYKTFELILVDDGSPDKSGEMCDSYASSDSRVKVIHKANAGLSSARNCGLEIAGGDYVIFLDSDDYWADVEALKLINDAIEKHPSNIVVWKYTKALDTQSQLTQAAGSGSIALYSLQDHANSLIKSKILFASACYMAVPRKYFTEFDLAFRQGVLSEDIEWFYRLLQYIDHVVAIDKEIYVYRQRQGSISHSCSKRQIKDFESHIETMSEPLKRSNKQILNVYLAEQMANYIITLSRYTEYLDELEFVKAHCGLLKYAVQTRSKCIKYCIKLLGLKSTLFMLAKIS